MRFDRALRQPEPLRDCRVRTSFSHQPKHLLLARRQTLDGIFVRLWREERRDDLRIEGRTAVTNTSRCVEKVVDIEHAVLQQIAEAAPRGDQLERVARLD